MTKTVANSGVMCTKLAIIKKSISSHVDSAGGATDPSNVDNMMKKHFEKLYNFSMVTK